MKRHREPETGLHNLLPNRQKAAAIKELIMRDFTEYYRATLEQLELDDKAIRLTTDAFVDICAKYYGKDYKISFIGVVRSGEKRIVLYPANLTSMIIYCGADVPPKGLPTFGAWEGEEIIYTLTENKNSIEPPVGKTEPKLVV